MPGVGVGHLSSNTEVNRVIRTLPLPPADEKPGVFTAAAADAVRDALARQIANQPEFVASVLYLLGLVDSEAFRLCDALLALDSERAA